MDGKLFLAKDRDGGLGMMLGLTLVGVIALAGGWLMGDAGLASLVMSGLAMIIFGFSAYLGDAMGRARRDDAHIEEVFGSAALAQIQGAICRLRGDAINFAFVVERLERLEEKFTSAFALTLRDFVMRLRSVTSVTNKPFQLRSTTDADAWPLMYRLWRRVFRDLSVTEAQCLWLADEAESIQMFTLVNIASQNIKTFEELVLVSGWVNIVFRRPSSHGIKEQIHAECAATLVRFPEEFKVASVGDRECVLRPFPMSWLVAINSAHPGFLGHFLPVN